MTRHTLANLAFALAVVCFCAYVCAGCFPNDPPATVPAVIAL